MYVDANDFLIIDPDEERLKKRRPGKGNFQYTIADENGR